jgi:uncharacterized ParB-like nuclease family protein
MKNIDKDSLNDALARNTLDDIPTPKSDAKEIIGLVKSGRLPAFGRCHRFQAGRSRSCQRRGHQRSRHRPPKRYGIFKIPAGRHGKQQSE